MMVSGHDATPDPAGACVRPARADDAASIAAVQVASWQVAYAHLLPADWLAAMSVPDRQATWGRVLAEGRSCVAVAMQGTEVVGFVSSGPSRDADAAAGTHEVYALYVHPSHWAGGHGRRLWAQARAAALAAVAGQTTLWVIVGNARGVAFYERMGCRCDAAARQGFDIDGVPLQEDRYRLVWPG
jgi:ribosomal protein S18 acetylase RimI-like enzyme